MRRFRFLGLAAIALLTAGSSLTSLSAGREIYPDPAQAKADISAL